MTLTEIIEAEFLTALREGGNPAPVLALHAGSKGPLYAALVRATTAARGELADRSRELTQDNRAAVGVPELPGKGSALNSADGPPGSPPAGAPPAIGAPASSVSLSPTARWCRREG